jgi:hypothetical protein
MVTGSTVAKTAWESIHHGERAHRQVRSPRNSQPASPVHPAEAGWAPDICASTAPNAAHDSAVVLADASAAGQTGHVRAADQAVETGVDCAAGAGETEIGRLVAGAARSAVAGTAA